MAIDKKLREQSESTKDSAPQIMPIGELQTVKKPLPRKRKLKKAKS